MTVKEAIGYLKSQKQIEFHSYGGPDTHYQCVDLANKYIELIGLTPVIGTNAKDFPLKIDTNQFEVIKNTPEFLPRTGDIPIWNGRVGGGAGHIAVVDDEKPTLSRFVSVDQNWSKKQQVTIETHNYKNVNYFLRPKGEHMSDDALKACLTDREKFWKERDEALEEVNKLSSEVSKLKERVSQERKLKEQELEQQKNELHQQCDVRVNESKDRLNKAHEIEIESLKLQVSTLKKQLTSKTPEWIKRFTSRKFIGAVLALLLPYINHWLGLDLSIEVVLPSVLGLLTYIGVEGYTDHVERTLTLK